MFGLIASIIAAVVSFGAGAAGMGKLNLPGSQQTSPIVTATSAACYNPQPNVKITLNWPTNFTNLTDRRLELNPKLFTTDNIVGTQYKQPLTVPPKFDSEISCQNLVMANKTTRNFILVRENVRISSCKTDELAGPFGKGICPGWSNNAVELSHRGICAIDGYPDLRKIAEVTQNGQRNEIFWNPFSYNVGCNYKQDENCGPGERRNLNLKDFIYVLKSRDAYVDPDNPGKTPDNVGCPVQWDAGSANYDACSHHFDVYMAEDFYLETKSAPATNDPESPYYFVKQVLENCAEKTMFIPAPEADLTVPPLFLKSPFIWQNDKTVYASGKIIPGNSQENINYTSYIWTFPDPFYVVKTASTTNLLRLPTDEVSGPFNFCTGLSIKTQAVVSPTPGGVTVPPNKNITDCYDILGSIVLKDEKGQNVKFKVYSKATTPQTFTFIRENEANKGYVYTITDKEYPTNERNDKSLQLRAMQMLQRNMWTWATPWCKPAIYMYPEKTTNVNVKLALDGKLTVSNPIYDAQNGWSVVAQPNGQLAEPLTLSDYPYLYYEADLNGVNIPKEGWVMEKSKIKYQISKIMTEIGFNEKEISDFMAYWLPRLTEKPYYFVTLLPEDVINQKEKLTFSVEPNSLIRSRFVFEGLDAPISVKPLTNIQTHSRDGFTVTDWGGTIVGQSCTDVTVK